MYMCESSPLAVGSVCTKRCVVQMEPRRAEPLRCCVPSCSNNERDNPGKVYYVFPPEKNRRSRWLKLIDRQDLTGATSDHRVCSDHFSPAAYTSRRALHKCALPSLLLSNSSMQEATCTGLPDPPPLKRKPTEELSMSKRPRQMPHIIAPISTQVTVTPVCGAQTLDTTIIKVEPDTETISDDTHHDMQVQVTVKQEHSVRNVACQTFSRKERFLSVAALTGAEHVDFPPSFTIHINANRSAQQTQTTVNLLTYFTNPVKKEMQLKIKEVNKKIKVATDAHMNTKRFMECCETYMDEKIAKIVRSHSNLQHAKFKGNRYDEDLKAFAIDLYFSNPQCYRFLEKIFNLPSRATLQRMQVPARTGITQNLMEHLKVKAGNMSKKEKICAICFDVMRISNNLWYEVNNDFLCGMQEIDQVMGSETAKYAAVLMLRGLYTNWKQPVSFAFMSEKRHYPELKEWLHNTISMLLDVGLDVKAFVAELGNEFIDVSSSDDEHHFEINGTTIYRFYDVRFLFRSARDAFMEYNFHFGSAVAQWKHVQKVYDKINNAPHKQYNLMPKITEAHLWPSADVLDDVNLATDVFSNSVAAAMNFLIITKMVSQNINGTVEFIVKMSKLLDILNCKTFASVYRGTVQQNQVLAEILEYLVGLKVKDKEGNLMEADFVAGLFVNIRSVVSLMDDLKKEGYQYLMAGCLNKEGPEEFFEQCRRLGGNCCERPTSIMFARSFKRLFLENLALATKHGENGQDLKSTLLKLGEYEVEKNEPECEKLKLQGVSDFKIQWPSTEYIAGYLLWKCLEKHRCGPLIEQLCNFYEFPIESDAATLLGHFKKFNAENVDSELLSPPESLVAFVDHIDHRFSEYFMSSARSSMSFGWNMYKYMEDDTFELPCECFPLKFMKIVFIRLKIEHWVREHNKQNKNPRKARSQQTKKHFGRKTK